MSFLRRLRLSRLLLLCGCVVIAGAGVAVAASLGGGPKPAPQPLASALHDAATATPVQGVSARISFTNSLLSSSASALSAAAGSSGKSPLLNGATGRLWASSDGHVRLELQSNHGDAEIVSDGRTLSYLDASSGTVYRLSLPPHQDAAGAQAHQHGAVPTVADIQSFLTKLMTHANVSGAVPDDVAGRPAYHVRISPSHDGGLIGGAELWWDAVHGVPLRVAIYAADRPDPVLELSVTDIHFGPVHSSVFAMPSAAKVVQAHLPAAKSAGKRHAGKSRAARHEATGPRAVAAQLPFALVDPPTLHGLARSDVRTLDFGGHPAALVTYGQGFGGLVVVERQADSGAAQTPAAPGGQGPDNAPSLPSVSINGARGTELVTALGTVVQFQRGSVDYIVAGSVPAGDAEAAARGL